jgi:hypothetical protein
MAGSNALAALRYQGGLKAEVQVNFGTIPTAGGNTDMYAIVPEDGEFHSADFSGNEAIAASDTNYMMFTIQNMGQTGIGTAQLLASGNVNTTRVTGGSALQSGSRKKLIPIATPAALQVKAGDRLRVRITGLGTLPNTVTGGVMLLRFVA